MRCTNFLGCSTIGYADGSEPIPFHHARVPTDIPAIYPGIEAPVSPGSFDSRLLVKIATPISLKYFDLRLLEDYLQIGM